MNLTGVINPSASNYVIRGLQEAEKRKAECAVLMLDTPGGMMVSMDEIVKSILEAKVPVVVYVAPKGARAASAGVFIALSANIIAMAPGTSMGAAHPVDMQGQMASKKIVNAASQSIKSIAEFRHRNTAWAVSTVKESKAVTNQEALQLKVADLIAEEIGDLLVKLDGRSVVVGTTPRKLSTLGSRVVSVEMSQRERFLQALGDPNIVFVLFTLGMLGLIYEFSAPGFGFAGIVGAICMILALYSFNAITVSMSGLLLMLTALIMFIMEVKIPSHGALTVGGVVAFGLGSLMLFSPHVPTFRISLALVGTVSVTMGLFFAFIVVKGLQAQMIPVVSGRETLVGAMGIVRSEIQKSPGGSVFAAGEEWSASTDGGAIPVGQKVKIIAVEGNFVKVVFEEAGGQKGGDIL